MRLSTEINTSDAKNRDELRPSGIKDISVRIDDETETIDTIFIFFKKLNNIDTKLRGDNEDNALDINFDES